MKHHSIWSAFTRNRAGLGASFGRLSVAIVGVALSVVACQEPRMETSVSPNGTRATADDVLPTNVLYIANNNPDGEQSIMAYRRNADGTLLPLPLPNNSFSKFTTGGSGIPNPLEKLGPEDLDYAMVTTEDRKFMFASNGGSNTISAFRVMSDGTLQAVIGSPFASGGINPAALYVAGNRLFVVNKNDNFTNQPNEENPNYRTFGIGENGYLTPVPDALFPTTPHSSPANFVMSPNGKVAFGTDFLAVMRKTGQSGTLRSFTVGPSGKLTAVTGTPMAVEGGGALGLWAHPKQNILYVGLPFVKKVAVYGYDDNSGQLNLVTAVPAGAAACWLRTNRAGTRLYCLNSAESTITVYNTENAAAPYLVQTYAMKRPGPFWYAPGSDKPNTSSEPFVEELSPDEKYLYVVNQHTNPDHTDNYNYLHTLVVGADGRLSQPSEPLLIKVGAHYRPQGLIIY